MKLIDKDALISLIKKIYNDDYKFLPSDLVESVQDFKDDLLTTLDTLEIKEVIAEQECTCNEALNRIIGDTWNLLCPVNKLGLKTGDKVKITIKAQKGE